MTTLCRPCGMHHPDAPALVVETADGGRWLVRRHWRFRTPYLGRVLEDVPGAGEAACVRQTAICLGVPGASDAAVA